MRANAAPGSSACPWTTCVLSPAGSREGGRGEPDSRRENKTGVCRFSLKHDSDPFPLVSSFRQTMNKLHHRLVFLGGQLLDGFQPRREAHGRLLKARIRRLAV